MSEIMRRQNLRPMSRRAHSALISMAEETQIEQASAQAISAVATHAMSEVLYLKRAQAMYEQQCPDAAEALALIANTATMDIAHQVRRFSMEMGG
uniref:ANTAR domain-containing protein n=1 Tax=Streptomyces sp. NBC_00093 TaxID=2975649 RepID=A0AAU2ABX2_9ACTN